MTPPENDERRPGVVAPGAASQSPVTESNISVRPPADRIVSQLRARLGFNPTPPTRTCPWCGAEPGAACKPPASGKGARLRQTPSGCHPSRREAAS